MGNVIIKDGILNTDTELGKFIQEWALNDYAIHPDAIKNSPKKFISSLKKRACCTYQPTVGIGIAGVEHLDLSGNITIIPGEKIKINGKEVLIDQYLVNIAPFTGANGKPSTSGDVINDRNCSLTNDSGDNQLFLDNATNKSKGVNGSIACQTFYDINSSRSIDKYGFARYVLRNRSNNDTFPTSLVGKNIGTDVNKLYKTPLGDQIKGLTPSFPDNDDYSGKANPYIDCNCVNSVFAVHPELFKDAAGNQIQPESLAQTIDDECTLSRLSAWKAQDNKVEKICFNFMSIGNVNVADTGSVALKQSCSLDGQDSSTGGKPATPAAATPAAATPAAATPPAATPAAATPPAATPAPATPAAATPAAATPAAATPPAATPAAATPPAATPAAGTPAAPATPTTAGATPNSTSNTSNSSSNTSNSSSNRSNSTSNRSNSTSNTSNSSSNKPPEITVNTTITSTTTGINYFYTIGIPCIIYIILIIIGFVIYMFRKK